MVKIPAAPESTSPCNNGTALSPGKGSHASPSVFSFDYRGGGCLRPCRACPHPCGATTGVLRHGADDERADSLGGPPRRPRLQGAVSLLATPSNAVEVAFGTSRDGTGVLLPGDVFAAKALVPPECGGADCRAPMEVIHLQGPIDVGGLVVVRLYRDEDCLPAATIGVDAQATLENLVVRDCRQTNRLARPVEFLSNQGRIDRIVAENNEFRGVWANRAGGVDADGPRQSSQQP